MTKKRGEEFHAVYAAPPIYESDANLNEKKKGSNLDYPDNFRKKAKRDPMVCVYAGPDMMGKANGMEEVYASPDFLDRRCPNCGAPCGSDFKYCCQCGAKLSDMDGRRMPPKPNSPKPEEI